MILRARSEGMVVERNVVPGNFYTSTDTLMTVARLDPLWVRGNVGEVDAGRVKVGQNLTVTIPYGHHPLKAKVEYIAAQVDPETQTRPVPDIDSKSWPRVQAWDVRAAGGRDRRTTQEHGRATSAAGTAVDGADTRQASALERKVDELRGEKEERLAHAKILERLEALERKLDRVLEGRR